MALRKQDSIAVQTVALFQKRFGKRPEVLVAAPGRVNLIGEHTDYEMGYVFPIALDRKTVVAAARGGIGIRIHSELFGDVEWPELPKVPEKEPHWWHYIVGAVREYCLTAEVELPSSLDIVVCTSVPIGGGLSSSAALEVGVATAMEAMYKKTLDLMVKAVMCQKVEHQWAGMPCGLMDQAICTLGKQGSAMMFDCQSKIAKHSPLPEDVRIIVINSGIRHQLVDGLYAQRKASCQTAVAAIKKKHPHVKFLRDCNMKMLMESKEDMSVEAFNRASHVIHECERCLLFSSKLEASEWAEAGKIMLDGHASLRDVYEVSIPEIDHIVEIASRLDGVFGARMTGGGFGGCVVAMVKCDAAEKACEEIIKLYVPYFEERKKTCTSSGVLWGTPSVFVVAASDGAHVYDTEA